MFRPISKLLRFILFICYSLLLGLSPPAPHSRAAISRCSYLHSCSPPVIHGNLTCDTIFIQHNGLVKIGSVAPDAIHHHVKTCRENMKNMHFLAPEYGCEYLRSPQSSLIVGTCVLIPRSDHFSTRNDDRHRYLLVWHLCAGDGSTGNPRERRFGYASHGRANQTHCRES